MRSLICRLMSRRMMLSTNSSRITPPSRMGMGSRLKIPRFRLIAAVSAIRGVQHFPYKFKDKERAFLVLLDRLAEGGSQRQGAYFHGQATKANTVALLLLTGDIRQHRLNRESFLLAIATDGNLDWFSLGALQSLDHCLDLRNGLGTDGQDFVAESYSSFCRWHIWFELSNRDAGLFGDPPRGPHLIYAVGFGHDGFVKRFPVALDGHIERLIRTKGFFGINLLPCGILDAVEAGDAIADLNSGFRRRSVGQHPANHCRLVQHRRIFVV